MIIISLRDFRVNQSKYLEMVTKGKDVILTSRVGNFKILPISEDDSITTKDIKPQNRTNKK